MDEASVRLNTTRQALVLLLAIAVFVAFAGFFVSAAVTTPAVGKRALAIVLAVLLFFGTLFWVPRWRRGYVVRLMMTPTPGKHAADAMLDRRLRGKWGADANSWSIPFGPVRELIAPLDAALRAHAGDRYRGVVNEGELPPGLL